MLGPVIVERDSPMSDMAIDYRHRPITVDEYREMGRIGILGHDERVELLDGELVALPPMGNRHAAAVSRLTRFFLFRLGDRTDVRPQLPTHLSPISEPQPDFALVVLRADFYAIDDHPSPSETFALVECAESSLAYDRGKKLLAYARAAVPEYWIVDLAHASIEIYRDPNDLGYASKTVAVAGERVAFEAFADVTFAVSELLGLESP